MISMNAHAKRLVVHVGTYKTGTSSIQAALAALSSNGEVLYPRSGLLTTEPESGIRHSRLCYSYGPGKMDNWQKMTSNLIQEINSAESRIVVLSAEAWARPKSHEGLRNLVKQLTSQCSVTAEGVCYFRNRFEYARSLYREFTRVRGNRRPSQPYLRNVSDMFDYLALARTFKEIFQGRMSYFVNERITDAVECFFQHLGLPEEALRINMNPKCGPVEAEVHRICNELGIKESEVDWRAGLERCGIALGSRFEERLPRDVLVSDQAYWEEFSSCTGLNEEEVAVLSREPDPKPLALDIALIRPLLKEVIMASSTGCKRD